MTCQNCVRHVTKALLNQKGVTRADVSLEKGSAEIESTAPIDFSIIREALKEEGYEASSDDSGEPLPKSRDPSPKPLENPVVKDEKAGMPARKDTIPLDFHIDGMHCATCVFTIEKALTRQKGVGDVRVNLATSTCSLSYDPTETTPEKLFNTVTESGYTPIPPEDMVTRNAFFHELVGLFLTGFITVALIFPLHEPPTGFWAFEKAILGVLLEIVGGGVFIRGAYNALKNRSANMDTLVALGTLSALIYSLLALARITPMTMFETQGLLLFFIRTGKILELSARNRAVSLLEGTRSLLPDRAFLISSDGSVKESPIDSLIPGDVIQIPRGARVPADGNLESQEAFLDESMMTGESLPVRRSSGEKIIGGSANTGDPFRMRITQTGTDTVLGRMVMAIRRAQNDRPPIQHLADRIASVFVPAVIAVALISSAVFFITTHSMTLATTALIGVLVVACPCAMGLATPTAILVGSSVALKKGIIFRRGSAMEIFAKATRIVFDKTGTLTKGTPEITSWNGVSSEKELVPILLPVVSLATHPLARALALRMNALQVAISPEEQKESWVVTESQGEGMKGSRTSRPEEELLLGRPNFLSFHGIILPVESVGKEEGSIVAVAYRGKYVGRYLLKDSIRPESPEVIHYFQTMGIKTSLLSGDHEEEALRISRMAGIPPTETYAGKSPLEKEEMIRQWRDQGDIVVMVGDGINDAAAMARANLGVAMGEGAAITRERGDLLLPPSGLGPLAFAHHIARLTLSRIRQNLWWAFGYNIAGIPLAAGVFYPLTHQFIPPTFDGLAMAVSSVIVVGNSLLLSNAANDSPVKKPQST
jgi:Cu+-exporting ATPase